MRTVKDGLPVPMEKLKDRKGLAQWLKSKVLHTLVWLGIELEK